MIKKWHCIMIGLGLLVPVTFGNDWATRLSEDDPADLAGEAQFAGQVDDLLSALGSLEEGQTLDGHYPFIERCLPGGHLYSSLSEKNQLLAVGLAVKASKNLKETFFRLNRVRTLTPAEELKEAAKAALDSVPAIQRPEGYNSDAIDPARMAAGKAVYNRVGICTTCHQPDGKGMPGVFPPLAGSDWMDGDSTRQIKIVLKGLQGPIKVGGVDYNGAMMPLENLLTDQEIADVLTYVQNSWGNKASAVSEGQVAKVRADNLSKAPFWNPDALLKEHPLREAGSE